MILIYLLSVLQLFKNSEQLCSTEVCFTWKVKPGELVLTCSVRPLKFRIKIIDPFNNVQADCTTPIPVETCEAHYKNVTIQQDAKAQKTVFEVHGKIDNRVNGIWTCLHGTGRGNASVEVTVLTIPKNNVEEWRTTTNSSNKNEYNIIEEDTIHHKPVEHDQACLRDAFLIGTSSFMFAAMCTYFLGFTKFLKALVECKECKNWKHVLILACGLAILALLIYTYATSVDCKYSWVVGLVSFAVGIGLEVQLMIRKCSKNSGNSEFSNNSYNLAPLSDIQTETENT